MAENQVIYQVEILEENVAKNYQGKTLKQINGMKLFSNASIPKTILAP